MAYNGHRNWHYWNVALHLGSDESLYNLARMYHRHARGNCERAARAFCESMRECGMPETSDGARYSIRPVRAAINGLFGRGR